MAKGKQPTEEAQLAALLKQMGDDGLPVQQGGFHVEALPSGIASFDHSTGIGGFPRRRTSVVQGEEGAGKTLLVLATIAHAQRAGGRAGFVDLEHALTPDFARLFGVDYEALVISRPRTLNEAYDVARTWAKSGLFDVVAFDSAVALATMDELEKKATQGGKRAGKAQVHSEELPKMISDLHERTAFIMINQLRENPSPPSWWRGGKMLYSPGGRAIRHNSSLTVDVRTTKVYRENNIRIGHRTETHIAKNKVAQPYQKAEFDLMYKTGVDRTMDLISTAIRLGVVRQSSSWFFFDLLDEKTGEVIDEMKWNGRSAMDEAVRDNPAILVSMEQQVLRTASHDSSGDTPDDFDPEDVYNE